MIILQTFSQAKTKEEVGQDLKRKVSNDELRAVNTYVQQQTGQKDYFKSGSTWGVIKSGFKDLNLNFNSFLDWYQKEYLKSLTEATGFVSHGGVPSPTVTAQRWLDSQKQRAIVKGTIAKAVKEAQSGKQSEQEGIKKTGEETRTIEINKTFRIPKKKESEEYGRGG